GNPRSVEDKLKLMCEGWYVRPKPPPEELTPEQQAEAAAVAAAAAAKGAKKAPEPAPAAKKPPTPGKKKRGGTPGGDLVPITAENEAQYLADLPKYITVELVVDHGTDHVVDLRNFSTNHPLDEEYLLAPLTQCRVHMIVPEQLKLCLRLINSAPLYPRTGEHVPMLMRPFVDRVMSDGRKSSAVAGKICNRLVNQFVKPHHCHRHPAQTYTAFCHECRQFICAACSKETHAAHHVEGISSVCHSIVQQKILPKVQQLKKKAVFFLEVKCRGRKDLQPPCESVCEAPSLPPPSCPNLHCFLPRMQAVYLRCMLKGNARRTSRRRYLLCMPQHRAAENSAQGTTIEKES
ncbi:zinc finger protein, putative, partial [Bodo saltans]